LNPQNLEPFHPKVLDMDDLLQDEEKKLRRLRFIVDFAIEYIRSQKLNHEEAIRIVEGVRKHALKLFPGKEDAFDIIYAPRFKRVLNEKFMRS
jgi:hemerythrin-like domain-containing protein